MYLQIRNGPEDVEFRWNVCPLEKKQISKKFFLFKQIIKLINNKKDLSVSII